MTSKPSNDIEPLLTFTSTKPEIETYPTHKKNRKIYVFVGVSIILIITAVLLVYFLVIQEDSSTSTISCNCNQDGFIKLDSNSCVLTLRDGTPPGNYQFANDIFNATGFGVNDYINVTDADGLPWVVFNETLQRYTWRYKWDFNAFLLLTIDENGENIKILIDAAVGIINPSIDIISANLYPILLEKQCQDIDIVIGTHMHADHTGWFINYNEEQDIINTFPNAKYIISSIEYEYWSNQSETMQNNVRFSERFPPILDHLDLREEDNYFIAPKVEIINCSGHTPGHQCIIFHGHDEENNNTDQSYLFWGDLIHREIQVSKPEIYPPFDIDPVAAMDKRIEILNLIHDNDMIVFPAHFNMDINPGKIVYCDTCFASNNLTWETVEI